MLGFRKLEHPVVDATAVDSISGKKPMAFVKYSHLEKEQGKYKVQLNLGYEIGSLASMATANSLTIIPEGTEVNTGDTIKVLPLNWTYDRNYV